jgi:hypothetical protein
MAIVFCRECGEKISDSAISCPRCGAIQKPKTQANWTMTFVIMAVLIGGGALISMFVGNKNGGNVSIPSGSYVLVIDNEKGINKVLHVIDEAKVGMKGLGNRLIIMGDSAECADLFTTMIGVPTRFAIKKTGGDNMFTLNLAGSSLPMQLTSQGRLRIYVGASDSLVYEKQ